ncbi:MAG: hypothetical protein ACK4VW_01450 [Anaerolineales bacterium]
MSSLRSRATSLFFGSLIATGLTFIAYTAIYFFPIVSIWKDIASSLIILVAAMWSAIAATMVWKLYRAEPDLRRVWGNFALALWLWTAADLIWTYQAFSSQGIQVGIADIFWLIAYPLFGIALYAQSKLLALQKWQRRAMFAAILASAFGLAFLFAYLLGYQRQETPTLHTFVNAFYPAGDLAIGLGALYVASLLWGGVLSLPWLAMFLFALSDALYAWLFHIGQYQALIEQTTWPQYVTDSLYLLAYLVIGLGCFTQWLTLRYGFFSYAEKS